MTNEEFDSILTRLGLTNKQVAEDMVSMGGGKTSQSYVAAMRKSRPVSQAAAIYAKMKERGHNQPDDRALVAERLRQLADEMEGK